MNSVEIYGLTKKYKNIVAVNNIDLIIKEHELFSLLGVNGAGKTTTIKMLTGLIKPTEGSAKVLGYDLLKDIQTIKENINISPQETAIAPNLTVKENLEFICDIYKILNKNEKVNEMINLFNLERIINSKAKILSGGWQRKVSIAMALITEPKILFLDEPTLGLDVIARRELWDSIKKIKENATIILTTHYMEEAYELSDRVAIMKDGCIVDVDKPISIVKKTKSKDFESAFVKIVSEVK